MRGIRARVLVKGMIIVSAMIYACTQLGIVIVHQQEMYPSIRDGDLCIACKKGDYKTQQTVLYYCDEKWHLGRIEAVPGETVNMDENGNFTVNDSVPYETIYYRTFPDPDSTVSYPLTLESGEYYVLNDYRSQYGDSRSWGPVRREDIKGSVILLFRHRGF